VIDVGVVHFNASCPRGASRRDVATVDSARRRRVRSKRLASSTRDDALVADFFMGRPELADFGVAVGGDGPTWAIFSFEVTSWSS